MRSSEEVKKLFIEAESAIAQLGPDIKFSVAAVNELRYAGKHLAEYIAAVDDTQKAELLERAARHCERALKDVADAVDVQTLSTLEEERRLNLLERLKNSAALVAGATTIIAALVSLIGRL